MGSNVFRTQHLLGGAAGPLQVLLARDVAYVAVAGAGTVGFRSVCGD